LLREIHLFSVRRKRRGRGIFAIRQQDLHALFGLLQLTCPWRASCTPRSNSLSASSNGKSPLSRRLTICSSSPSAVSKLAGASFFFGIVNIDSCYVATAIPGMVTKSRV
jgi:hypothetical protein